MRGLRAAGEVLEAWPAERVFCPSPDWTGIKGTPYLSEILIQALVGSFTAPQTFRLLLT